MLLDVDQTVAIARRPAVGAGLSFAGQTHAHFVVDAGGNHHIAPHGLGHESLAAAFAARIFHHLARPMTGRASSLHAEEAGGLHHLAAAAAVAATLRLAPLLSAGAAAFGTLLVALELDCLGDAARRFQQIKPHFAADIATLASLPPSGAAENVAEDPPAQNIAERLEDFADVAELVDAGTFETGVTEAVVASPFVGVVEHLEGFSGLLEADHRLLVAGVLIRMVLDRQLAVGVGNLLAARLARDAENLVVVSLGRHLHHGRGGTKMCPCLWLSYAIRPPTEAPNQ